MRVTTASRQCQKTARFAFAFAMVACVLGLAFMMVKSPSSRSDVYLSTAAKLSAENHAEQSLAAAYEAVRLDPSQVAGWKFLSRLLQQNGQEHKAAKAQQIAERLENSPAKSGPLYAMPAELKLSLLAEAVPDVR